MTWEGKRGGFFFALVYRWPHRDRIYYYLKMIKFVIVTYEVNYLQLHHCNAAPACVCALCMCVCVCAPCVHVYSVLSCAT